MHSDVISETDLREQAKRDGITHISTGVAVLRNGKILMVRRAKSDFLGGSYELPGGGVDEAETIIEGALRELKEETGLAVTKIVAIVNGFDYSTDRKPHVRQINLIVKVGPGEVALDPREHDDFVWVDETNLDTLTMTKNMRRFMKGVLQQRKG